LMDVCSALAVWKASSEYVCTKIWLSFFLEVELRQY
jgi:hypothetical protein